MLLTNLLEHQRRLQAPDVGYRITDGTFPSWLSAQNVRIFTFGPYKLLMQKVMKSLSIGYPERYFSGNQV